MIKFWRKDNKLYENNIILMPHPYFLHSFSLIFSDLHICLCPLSGLFWAFSVWLLVVHFCYCFRGLFLVFWGFSFLLFFVFFCFFSGAFSGCFLPRQLLRNACLKRVDKKRAKRGAKADRQRG